MIKIELKWLHAQILYGVIGLHTWMWFMVTQWDMECSGGESCGGLSIPMGLFLGAVWPLYWLARIYGWVLGADW